MSATPRSGGLPPRAGRPASHIHTPREEVYNTQVVIMRLRRDGRRGRMIFFAVLGLIVAGVAVLLSLHANRTPPSPTKAISMDSSMREFRPLQDLRLPPPPQHTVVELSNDDSDLVTAPRPLRAPRAARRWARAQIAAAAASLDDLFSGCEVTPPPAAPRAAHVAVMRGGAPTLLKYGR